MNSTLAALFISGREWLVPATVLFVSAIVLLLWSYRHSSSGVDGRFLCASLKLAGLAALGFCLLEPLWSTQRARPGANFFAVVADNSQGMQIKDRGATLSRGEGLRELLTSEKATWLEKLDETFQVRRYVFDSRLQSSKDFGELQFDGRSSAIGAALRVVAERYQGQPLAGVLLLTDGNATDLADASSLPGLPPVYPVVIGNDDTIKDITVQKVSVSQTAFEDAPVTVEATILANGYTGSSVTAQLFELTEGKGTNARPPRPMLESANGPGSTNVVPAVRPVFDRVLLTEKIAGEQTGDVPREGEPMVFRFQVRPARAGISYYRLRVSAHGELDQFENQKLSTEATLANNSRMVVVDRGRGPYRVLYVTGRPNWEFKFLNRALAEDDQVRLTALIRVAKREPKFEFKGRAGESSNPLFRGFDKQGDDTERYDQPVLKVLTWNEGPELEGDFPKTAEELYGYHAVILAKLEAEFFTHDQMVLLEKFVSERGGGFLMLGGMESFHEGKYDRTPIADLLPVYLDRVPPNESRKGKDKNVKMGLTREGWLQPWARLRSNEADERTRLDAMPPLQVLNRVRDIKPGASVLATVTDSERKEHPALIVQRFGRGRSAAHTIGDLWLWGFQDPANMRDLEKSWRQMTRWLVADVPNRVELQTEQKTSDQNQSLVLQVRARDKKFQPLENATVHLNVRFVGTQLGHSGSGTNSSISQAEMSSAISGKSVPLSVEPALSEAGLYQSAYISRETGGYLAEAVVTDSTGAEVGHAEAGWTADPAADEFRSLKPNRALLEAIAKKTGGEVVLASKLEEFTKRLPSRKVPITESTSFPLWHTPLMFLFAVGCFAAEWGLRRWKGLA
ncbi:MAG: glutamine amidotransferase [Verrucomicrobiales bacterium]|nr:glutamine amidotransferase [Verrucomicrobiales bacterium]